MGVATNIQNGGRRIMDYFSIWPHNSVSNTPLGITYPRKCVRPKTSILVTTCDKLNFILKINVIEGLRLASIWHQNLGMEATL
jgi:hypothetical protein